MMKKPLATMSFGLNHFIRRGLNGASPRCTRPKVAPPDMNIATRATWTFMPAMKQPNKPPITATHARKETVFSTASVMRIALVRGRVSTVVITDMALFKCEAQKCTA